MNTNTLSVDGNSEVIYETGVTITESIGNDSTVHKGSVKYINVWKRQPDNTYKLSIDFCNSDK
jgi:ketosteroid isomerase-like protein